MLENERRMMFIGMFLDPEMQGQIAGCTVGQCVADTQGLALHEIRNLLGCDQHDIDRWVEAGRRFV